MRGLSASEGEKPRPPRPRPTRVQFAAMARRGELLLSDEFEEIETPQLNVCVSRYGDTYIEMAPVDPWDEPYTHEYVPHLYGYGQTPYQRTAWPGEPTTPAPPPTAASAARYARLTSFVPLPSRRATAVAPAPLPPTPLPPPVPHYASDFGPIKPGSACDLFHYGDEAEKIVWLYSSVTVRVALPTGGGGTETYDLTTVRGCYAWGNTSKRYWQHLSITEGVPRNG